MGRGLYTTTQASETATKSTVVQGALEDSNVQPIAEINNLIQIMRNYEQVSNMISNENQRHSTAIDRLSQTT